MNTIQRPISPHVGIYRKQITSFLSILHRLTGVALYVGTLLIIAFLVVVAYFPLEYQTLHAYLASPLGKTVLFGWTYAFFFHLLNGIRHLFWDIGKGFEIPTVNKTGWLVVIFSLLFSVASWFIAYQNAGIL
jgi:succinate dehydrogenase / fumarate reductase cytochrome b subunit